MSSTILLPPRAQLCTRFYSNKHKQSSNVHSSPCNTTIYGCFCVFYKSRSVWCVMWDVTKFRHFSRGACVNLVHFAGLLHCAGGEGGGGGGGAEAQRSVIFVLICVTTKMSLSMGMIVTFGALDVINNNFGSICHLLRLLLRAELFAVQLFQLHLPYRNLRCCLVLGGAMTHTPIQLFHLHLPYRN
jgi:hypothetical protein